MADGVSCNTGLLSLGLNLYQQFSGVTSLLTVATETFQLP